MEKKDCARIKRDKSENILVDINRNITCVCESKDIKGIKMIYGQPG